MAEFLVLIAEREAATAAEAARRNQAHADFAEKARAATREAGRVRPRSEGKRVTRTGVEDGSFDDAFERYLWLRVEDLDGALALVDRMPLDAGQRIDIHPLLGGDSQPAKLDQPGKVFAFSVLGRAHDEPAWTALMDAIARETEHTFPPDRFAGGLRLRPPSTGRRIELERGTRRVIDGPFLESKEIIGGLFFLRMASLDEAVRWAVASPFLARGALEIRELWRA